MVSKRYVIKDSVNHKGKKMVWDNAVGQSVFDNMTPQNANKKVSSLNRRTRFNKP